MSKTILEALTVEEGQALTPQQQLEKFQELQKRKAVSPPMPPDWLR